KLCRSLGRKRGAASPLLRQTCGPYLGGNCLKAFDHCQLVTTISKKF
ncbi:MAG: hypothetical protein ACI95X_001822, partial [Paraglaciecola sp.]